MLAAFPAQRCNCSASPGVDDPAATNWRSACSATSMVARRALDGACGSAPIVLPHRFGAGRAATAGARTLPTAPLFPDVVAVSSRSVATYVDDVSVLLNTTKFVPPVAR